MKNLLLLLCIAICVKSTFGQCVMQNPKPTNNTLNGIFFTDKNTGYIIGELGTLMKTTDGGATWNPQSCGATTSLNKICFLNASTGYIVGDGVLLKTKNGGNSWVDINTGTTKGYNFSSISFLNEDLGFVGGGGGILKTKNGGETWEKISTGKIRSIFFFSEAKGYALFDEANWDGSRIYKLRKTINGGASWMEQSTQMPQAIVDVFFCNENTGFVTGSSGISKTANGGMTWSFTSIASNSMYFNVPYFINENMGFVGPNVKTSDGGTTWKTFNQPSINVDYLDQLQSLFFLDANNGFSVYNGLHESLIFKTQDGGTTWSRITSKQTDDLLSVHFPSKLDGYAVGKIGSIYKTTNGGETWIKLSTNTTKAFISVWFTNTAIGFALDGSNMLWKTSDGGSTWTQIQLNNKFGNSGLNSVYFLNNDLGYIAGSSGTLFKTTDGGKNWTDLSLNIGYSLESIFFTDNNNGYAIGNDYFNGSMIMKTSDGAKTWDFIWTSNETTYEYNLKSIRFINNKFGYIFYGQDNGSGTSSNIGILKTVDGGLNWAKSQIIWGQSDLENVLGNVFFIDDQTGYNVSEGGALRKTTNGGNTWSNVFSGTSKNLTNLYFTDANTGYAIGDAGTIIKISNGFPSSTEELTKLESTFQIYPNPATDKITIITNELLSTDFTISIFNAKGELIMQNEVLNQQKVDVNIRNYSKGIYLLEVQSNKSIETKKIVIQ